MKKAKRGWLRTAAAVAAMALPTAAIALPATSAMAATGSSAAARNASIASLQTINRGPADLRAAGTFRHWGCGFDEWQWCDDDDFGFGFHPFFHPFFPFFHHFGDFDDFHHFGFGGEGFER